MSIELLDLVYYDFYQGLLTTFILLAGLGICLLLSKRRTDIKYIVLLYLWHILFSLYYWYFTLSNTADAVGYYRSTFNLVPNFSPGTRFVETLTYIIVKTLGVNYLNTALIANIFGSIGLILLYLSLDKLLRNLNRLWLLILFIPSMSFWSAGLGKDSISFMATCLFLYTVTTLRRKTLPLTFAFLAMFMVRPHIAFVMLVSFVIYFIFRAKIHIVFKTLTLPIVFASAFIALQFVQQYVGLSDVSLDSLDSYVDKRQGYNQGGGSSLDITSMSYPMQMFTYIFRPLPFEAHSIVALITSIENTLLLLFFIYITFKSRFNFRTYIKDKNLWLFLYVFITCSILAITTANLGIATRQKWMFMPVLIYLVIYTFYDYKTKKNKVYS